MSATMTIESPPRTSTSHSIRSPRQPDLGTLASEHDTPATMKKGEWIKEASCESTLVLIGIREAAEADFVSLNSIPRQVTQLW